MAAQFEESREKITEMPVIIKDLCRVLYHKVRTFEMIAVFLEWLLQNQISAKLPKRMFPVQMELYFLSSPPNKRVSVLVYVSAITIKNTTSSKLHEVSSLVLENPF